MSRDRRRPIAAASVAVLVAIVLSGCSVVQRTAVRLGPNDSIEFASCESVGIVDSALVEYSTDDDVVQEQTFDLSEPVTAVVEGTVLQLGIAPAKEDWDRVFIAVNPEFDDEGVRADWDLQGSATRDEFADGDWVWAQTVIFVGAIDVEKCELDD